MVSSQFRNWIPRLATQRFGDAEIDPITKQLSWGKYLTLWNTFNKDFLNTLSSVNGKLNDASYAKIKEKYEELLTKHLENGGLEEDFVTLSQFTKQYISNLRSALLEVAVMTSLFTLITTLLMYWTGDDEDNSLTGPQRYALRTLNKLQNEITFYVSPTSFTELFQNAFPVISVVKDLQGFVGETTRESFNLTQQLFTGDESKDLEKTRPMVRGLRLFPITKEMLTWYAVIDEDFRKENKIRIQY